MKALTIQQPYAWLIVHGVKTIENRTFATRHRGPLLIHAGKQRDPGLKEAARIIRNEFGFTPVFEFGGIIGRVTLADVLTESDDEWFEGPYGWLLADPIPLAFAPCPGRLGLFNYQGAFDAQNA